MGKSKPKKRNRRLTMQEKRDLMEKLNGKLTPDELEYLNTLVNRQIKEACDGTTRKAIATAYGVMFRVLLDKFDFDNYQLHKLWTETEAYGKVIASGEVKLRDVLLSLWEENEIMIDAEELVEGDDEAE